MFHGMCHVSAISDAEETRSSATPMVSGEPVVCQIESNMDSLPKYTASCSNAMQSTSEELAGKESHCFTRGNRAVSNASRLSEKLMWEGNSSLQSDMVLTHSSLDDSLEELDDSEERIRIDDNATSGNDCTDKSNQSYQMSVNVPSPENSDSGYFKCSAKGRPNYTATGETQSATLGQQTSNSVLLSEGQDNFFTSNPVSFVNQDMESFKLFPGITDSPDNPKSTYRSNTRGQGETNSNSSWTMQLLSSSKISRRYHTQNQTKSSATNSLSSLPNTDNSWPRLATSTVKSRPVHSSSGNPIRTPVKSLDLGFGTLNNPNVHLRSNDRVFPQLETSYGSRSPVNQSRDDRMSHHPSTKTLTSTSVLDSIVPSQHVLPSPNRGAFYKI